MNMQKRLVLHVHFMYGSLSITAPVSHLENEYDVRSILYGQVSFENVNMTKRTK